MSFLKKTLKWFEQKSVPKEPVHQLGDTRSFPPGQTYVVVGYQPGQTRFVNSVKSDDEEERQVHIFTQLQDSSVVTPETIANIRKCPNCGRVVLKESLKECLNRGCYQIVCNICSPDGLCKKCVRARFWGIE